MGDEKNSFALLALVAVVAIVGLIVMVTGSSHRAVVYEKAPSVIKSADVGEGGDIAGERWRPSWGWRREPYPGCREICVRWRHYFNNWTNTTNSTCVRTAWVCW